MLRCSRSVSYTSRTVAFQPPNHFHDGELCGVRVGLGVRILLLTISYLGMNVKCRRFGVRRSEVPGTNSTERFSERRAPAAERRFLHLKHRRYRCVVARAELALDVEARRRQRGWLART